MVTEQEEISLGYLLDPAFQLVNSNGKPLTDGWIECYIHGTRNKYYCYSDWNGNLHPFRVPIDSIGSNVVLADPNRAYDVYVYNKYGTLVMSRYNVSPGHASGASVGGSGDAGHWIARLGSTTTAPKNQYSNSIPIPANPDYEGDFVDRINGNNIYLKEGVYLVDAILRFRQNPDDLSNTFGDIHVFTGVDDSETVVYNRNETGPDADETDYHQIRVQFVRHVTGNTDDVVCFQVKSTNALSWIQIQNLSIVNLGGGSGVAPQPIEYSAGQYISIDNDTISVTGLQPSGNYADSDTVAEAFNEVAQDINTLSGAIDEVSGSIPSIEGLASEQYVDEHIEEAVSGKQDELEFTYDEDEKITSIDGHEIAGTGGGSTYSPGQYIKIENDVISVTGLQESGNYLTPEDLNGYATTEDVEEATSGKLDSSAYQAPVNADWNSESGLSQILNKPESSQLIPGSGISIVQSGDNYIINSFGGGSTYQQGQYIKIDEEVISVTGLQPSGEYLTSEDLNGYATTQDVEAAVSGKADVSAIPSVAGLASEQYVDEHITEATSGKADVSAIPSLNGYATEEWVGQQGYLTSVPSEYITETELESELSGKADVSAIPSVAGLASETYVDQKVEEATSGKADVSAIPSLQGYATESWVTEQGYLTDVPAGYATTEDVNAATSGKMDASEASAFYPMASNPSGYLTEHQSLAGYATEQYVQDQTSGFVDSGYVSQYVESAVSGKQDELEFTYNEEDKISAINGSAIAGGSEVPEGVMTESGLKYNAVGEISGYGDSAIAQYGAEKQWLVHDDTIVHMSNSAQYAFGVNVSAVAQLLGIDETVLFETNTDTSTATLSENVSSFKYVDFNITDDNGGVGFIHIPTEYGNYKAGCYIPSLTSPDVRFAYLATSDGTTWTADGCQKVGSSWMNIGSGPIRIKKVVGIGRKQST